MMSEKTVAVLNYLKGKGDKKVTSEDIAVATGFTKKQVDGIVTAGLIRNKDLAVRIPSEIELPDGTHKSVKFIELTPAGKDYDPTAEAEAVEE